MFAPDPFYTIDGHVDHVNLGKTVYYIWSRLKKKPPLLLYYTYKPNFYVSMRYRKEATKGFQKHVSQGFAKPMFLYFSWLVRFIFGFFTPHAILPETYRVVGINPKKYINPVRPIPILNKILGRILEGIGYSYMPDRDFYRPKPKKLGLKEFRFNIEE